MNSIEIRNQEEWDDLPKKFEQHTLLEIRSKEIIFIRANPENSETTLYDSSSATLFNSSSAELYNSSSAELYNSSSARLYNSSSARLYNSSSARLYNSSSARLYDSSSARLFNSSSAELFDSSSARLYNSSSARLYDSSSARLFNSSSATLFNSSSAELYNSSSAELYNSSSARLYNSSSARLYDSSSARLYDSSSARLFNSSSAELFNSSSAELYNSSSAELYNSSSARLYENTTAIKFSKSIKITSFDKSVIADHSEKASVPFNTWLERGMVVCDGIYRELKSQKTIGDVTIFETDKGYVAKKGDKTAHGETIEEAKNDLRYKISDRDTSKYSQWTTITTVSTEEMIEAYMTITGACSMGTKEFCERNITKDRYSVSEIIEITNGQYGADAFEEFFE